MMIERKKSGHDRGRNVLGKGHVEFLCFVLFVFNRENRAHLKKAVEKMSATQCSLKGEN